MQLVQPSIDSTNQILAEFSELANDWPGSPWIWEDRFACALTVIETHQISEVSKRLMTHLPRVFGTEEACALPIPVERAVYQSGGLRRGQLVYWGNHIGEAIPYALWWPWTNNRNISIRVALAHR